MCDEFGTEYMKALGNFLRSEKGQKRRIYPKTKDWFRAFDLTPFETVKVVILGQDPYHGENQAHGLCFSVPPGVSRPPSLRNIIAEVERDVGIRVGSESGCLESWARQGVLLLNSVLSVRAGAPASHANQGWERFTDRVIQVLSERAQHLVFMLWGSYARRKGAIIDRTTHMVLEAGHPSPLSVAHFSGCAHFSRANEWLRAKGQPAVDWAL